MERAEKTEKAAKAHSAGALTKRRAAWIAVLVVGAGAAYYVAATTRPGEPGYYYRLMSPLVCAGLLVAEELTERILGVRTSDGTSAFIKLFALACIVGGKAFGLYGVAYRYDKLLHTVSGVLFTVVGAELYSYGRTVSPVAAAAFGVLVALASGYLWELYEFAGDTFFGLSSQNWADGVVSYSPETGLWTVTDARGTALIDTMTDMIVNFIGSLVTAPFIAAKARFSERIALRK